MNDTELRQKMRVLLNKYYTMNLKKETTEDDKHDLVFKIAEKTNNITRNWVNETRAVLNKKG